MHNAMLNTQYLLLKDLILILIASDIDLIECLLLLADDLLAIVRMTDAQRECSNSFHAR